MIRHNQSETVTVTAPITVAVTRNHDTLKPTVIFNKSANPYRDVCGAVRSHDKRAFPVPKD